MRDSVTYMAILDEGRAEGQLDEVRKLLVRLGQKSLRKPSKRVVAAISAIDDLDRLERLLEHLNEVENWRDLLAIS